MRELNLSLTYQEMFVGGADVDGASCDGLAVLGFLDRKTRLTAQQLWNLTFVPGIEVLHDENGGAARLNRTHDLHERGQTSGRRANGDEVTTLFWYPLFSFVRSHFAYAEQF